jgi:hypothetical protein
MSHAALKYGMRPADMQNGQVGSGYFAGLVLLNHAAVINKTWLTYCKTLSDAILKYGLTVSWPRRIKQSRLNEQGEFLEEYRIGIV